MSDTFQVCTLPWRIWPWDVSLFHSYTDVSPECSVEFGVMVARPTRPYELWVKVDFEMAELVSAKPHADDEGVFDVSGYDISPTVRDISQRERWEAEWLQTGVCPDPRFYFSRDSRWLEAERQRNGAALRAATHFVLDGRDGYVEILAAGFTWQAWRPGRPRLNEVSGEPIMTGRWTDVEATTG
jgi:hypothetical protein